MADLLLDSKEVILKTPGKVDGEMVKGWCGVQMSEIRMVILLVIVWWFMVISAHWCHFYIFNIDWLWNVKTLGVYSCLFRQKNVISILFHCIFMRSWVLYKHIISYNTIPIIYNYIYMCTLFDIFCGPEGKWFLIFPRGHRQLPPESSTSCCKLTGA